MSASGWDVCFPLAALSSAAMYNIGLIVVLLALLIAGVMGYRAWQEAHEEIEPATPEELLASFERARFEGEMDAEEYERVRRQLDKSAHRPGPTRQPGPRGNRPAAPP
jgi:hypothetical protein